jgi:hypothetical protein
MYEADTLNGDFDASASPSAEPGISGRPLNVFAILFLQIV